MVFLIGLACMAAGIAGLALLAWVIQFSVRNGIRRSGLIPLDRLYEIERFEAGDPQRLSVDGLREKYGDGAESHMREFVDDRTSSRSWKALIVAIVGIVVSALLFVGVAAAYSFDSSDSSDRNGSDSSYSSDGDDDDSDSSYSDSDDDSDDSDYDFGDYE